MTLLYDRKYSLVIGLPSTVGTVLTPEVVEPIVDGTTSSVFQEGGIDFRTNRQLNAVEITDLQIQASITGTANNSSNTGGSGIIKIFNLSKVTRDLVEKTNAYVILSAGYSSDIVQEDDQLPIIFSGQVETYTTYRQGANLITELKCKEGYTVNSGIKVTKSFPRESTYSDVIYYLASIYEMNGIPLGDVITDWSDNTTSSRRTNPIPLTNGVLSNQVIVEKVSPQDYAQIPVLLKRPTNTKLLTGYSATGYLHQVLDKLCSQIGYVSYITNSKLFIHPKGYTKTVEEFEFTSGQMKSIRPTGSKLSGSSKGEGIDGVTIKTFLDGRLDIDKRIRILDGEYSGSYKVINKKYELDYENGSWDVSVDCKRA
tara:strand:+ start:1535 stop:2644 length:1110 start_codon:yes stop_codon:yes gene_type:complete